MRVTFAGGAGSIGASCIVIECGGSSVVVDCGIRPGDSSAPLPDLSSLSGKAPDAILVTHAHMDHSGGLPVLADAFAGVPIITTPPTIELIAILLNDSLKLMNSPEREGEIPLYTRAQVDETLARFVPVHHGQSRTVGELTVTFFAAGHILGASMIHIATPEGLVLVTGDYSVTAQRTVGALLKPPRAVDLLISEATYGERLHEDRTAAEERLLAQIREVIAREGRVLIPSFAVGRAQEILLILRKAMRNGRLDKVPVYVDGMVKAVCNLYSRHERYVTRSLAHDIRSSHPFFTDPVEPVDSPRRRRAILDGGPCIIVASSGMLSGGASVVYARELLKNERDAVLLTGYQDEEAPGRALLTLAGADEEQRNFTLGKEPVEVKAAVELFGLSAHADRLQMTGLIESLRPRTVVLVHGDEGAREALKRSLSVRDCLHGRDGMVIERSYPVRGVSRRSDVYRLPEESDFDRVRAILGPPSHVPVRAREVAEAWFGERVDAALLARFVERLVELDLVRRHDERRNYLWVLSPAESSRLVDEAEQAQTLKAHNPKGRLLEHCMRLRIPSPAVEWGTEGAYHTARMRLEQDGTVFDSGTRYASERVTAEQLAARRVLELCEEHERAELDGAIVDISDEQAIALKASNPKGRLLEEAARRKSAAPRLEARVIAGRWCCRVRLPSDTGESHSRWYRAASKVIAEQGAASEVVSKLSEQPPDTTEKDDAGEGQQHPPASEPHGKDPRITLNELRQRRYLDDFGYELVDRGGPPHAPRFTVRAWARTGEQSVLSEPCTGSSKKEAERRAAADLVGRIAG